MLKKLSVLILSGFASHAMDVDVMQIPGKNFFVPQRIAHHGNLFFEQGKFHAVLDEKTHKIHSCDVRGLPKDLTEEKLRTFLSYGYLSLREIGNDFGIEGNLRLLGGTGDKTVEKKDEDPCAWWVGAGITTGVITGGTAGWITVATASATFTPLAGAAMASTTPQMGATIGGVVGGAAGSVGAGICRYFKKPNDVSKN